MALPFIVATLKLTPFILVVSRMAARWHVARLIEEVLKVARTTARWLWSASLEEVKIKGEQNEASVRERTDCRTVIDHTLPPRCAL